MNNKIILDRSGTNFEKLRSLSDDNIIADDIPYNINNAQEVDDYWKDAILTQGGGVKKTCKEFKEKNGRGIQKNPVKIPVSIRLTEPVVEYFKSTGKGWQTRMDKVLQDYILSHK